MSQQTRSGERSAVQPGLRPVQRPLPPGLFIVVFGIWAPDKFLTIATVHSIASGAGHRRDARPRRADPARGRRIRPVDRRHDQHVGHRRLAAPGQARLADGAFDHRGDHRHDVHRLRQRLPRRQAADQRLHRHPRLGHDHRRLPGDHHQPASRSRRRRRRGTTSPRRRSSASRSSSLPHRHGDHRLVGDGPHAAGSLHLRHGREPGGRPPVGRQGRHVGLAVVRRRPASCAASPACSTPRRTARR